VGGATGVVLCTITRTFSTSESMSSTEKPRFPESAVRSTLGPSPASTLKRRPSSCEDNARRMLLATPVSLLPESTNTVTSTGSRPDSPDTRNNNSPLEEALPLELMLQASASGGEFAARTAPAATSVTQAAPAASRVTQKWFGREYIESPGVQRPGEIRGFARELSPPFARANAGRLSRNG
jgi:hypothetical protein